jgi:endonuclease III
MTPPDEMVEAHLLLIEHGRRTCTARRPRCPDCVLLDLCPYGQAALGLEAAVAPVRRQWPET